MVSFETRWGCPNMKEWSMEDGSKSHQTLRKICRRSVRRTFSKTCIVDHPQNSPLQILEIFRNIWGQHFKDCFSLFSKDSQAIKGSREGSGSPRQWDQIFMGNTKTVYLIMIIRLSALALIPFGLPHWSWILLGFCGLELVLLGLQQCPNYLVFVGLAWILWFDWWGEACHTGPGLCFLIWCWLCWESLVLFEFLARDYSCVFSCYLLCPGESMDFFSAQETMKISRMAGNALYMGS